MAKFNRRAEMLVNRFFEIIETIEEEEGDWNELFLIRDLLMEEYINGNFSQVEIIQIDNIIEEELDRFIDMFNKICNMFNIICNGEVELLEKDIWNAFADKNTDKCIELLINYRELLINYREAGNAHPYVYYCAVRELERITGENYIELVLPISSI